MAERMGYIFHPTPYPPSLPFIPHVLFLIFLHLSVGIIFLLQLFRCPRCQEFSTPSYFHFRTPNRFINFQPKALTPDRVFFFFFYFFFFSFSFFPISCICATVSKPLAGFGIFIFLEIPAGNRFRRDFLFFNGYLPS